MKVRKKVRDLSAGRGLFRLKIMQVCGYLNSRYVPVPALLGNQPPAKI